MNDGGMMSNSEMQAYATVGMTRIQSYLARSRHLWGRRGASERLAEATYLPKDKDSNSSKEHPDCLVDKVLANHKNVKINEEGLDIDGVVSLRTKNGGSVDDVKKAADELANAIARENPGITLTVSWTPNPTDKPYACLVAAQFDLNHWEKETRYPAASEFPLFRPCDECGIDPATRKLTTPDGQMRLCQDCAGRISDGDTNRTQRERTLGNIEEPKKFSVEWKFLDRLIRDKNEKLDLDNDSDTEEAKKQRATLRQELAVDDFKDLARIGASNDRETRESEQSNKSLPNKNSENAGHSHTFDDNHVALIFADGNGIGGLFQKLADDAAKDGSTGEMRKVSAAMKDATNDALLTTTKVVMGFDEAKNNWKEKQCPVVPHIVGGDDILVSVSANYAWKFLFTFLEKMRTNWSKVEDVPDSNLSLSAGMVICKAGYPFGNQVELAEKLLKRAKTEVRGQDWSFTWLDLSYDGDDVSTHHVWRLEENQNFSPVAEDSKDSNSVTNQTNWCEALKIAYSEMTAHSRSQLRLILAHKENRCANLKHFANRMPEVEKFLAECGGIPKEKTEKEEVTIITDEQAKQIDDLIAMGRWWRELEATECEALTSEKADGAENNDGKGSS